jgi:hypothetical protein
VALAIIYKSLGLKTSHLGPPHGAKMAATAVPARSLFCLICSIAYCVPIERAAALYFICIHSHYPQLASERSRSADPAGDGPPPPHIIGVHGLTAHPVYTKNFLGQRYIYMHITTSYFQVDYIYIIFCIFQQSIS